MFFHFINKISPKLSENLRELKQSLGHTLRLYPIYTVISKINTQFDLKNCVALEAFARTGSWQARAYKNYPNYLEAWEIDPLCEAPLKKNLPSAKVKITDSIQEIQSCSQKFNFINVDTHQGIYGPYCEHFEFYPLIFNCLQDEAVILLNTIPYAEEKWLQLYEELFSAEHLRRRKEFYKTANPANISFDEMLNIYKQIAESNGYQIVWHQFHKRTLTYYLALHLKKK